MKNAKDAATPSDSTDHTNGLDSLSTIERTQQQLWLLALLLFALVTLSLVTMDVATATEWLFGGMASRTRAFLDHYGTSIALFVVLLLVCGYFSERFISVRNRNRQLIGELDAAARILALRNHQLDTWDQLSHQPITNFNLPRLLELIVRTAAEVTESDSAAVLLSDADSPHLRLAAIHHRGLQTDLARRVATRVIHTGEALRLSPDALPEEFDRPDLSWDDLVGIAASPLAASETVGGALLVGRCRPAADYHDNVVTVLASFANQASIAIEKAWLYAENQRQLQQLSRLLDQLRAAHVGSPETDEETPPAEGETLPESVESAH
jgi:hypothetical protein